MCVLALEIVKLATLGKERPRNPWLGRNRIVDDSGLNPSGFLR